MPKMAFVASWANFSLLRFLLFKNNGLHALFNCSKVGLTLPYINPKMIYDLCPLLAGLPRYLATLATKIKFTYIKQQVTM